MKKEILKKIYLLKKQIEKLENNLIPKEYNDWNKLYFEDLRDAFDCLYEEFDDNTEYSILERVECLMDDKWLYDTRLLKKEDRKKYTVTFENWSFNNTEGEESKSIILSPEFKKNCSYCFINLYNLDEVLDYVIKELYN